MNSRQMETKPSWKILFNLLINEGTFKKLKLG